MRRRDFLISLSVALGVPISRTKPLPFAGKWLSYGTLVTLMAREGIFVPVAMFT